MALNDAQIQVKSFRSGSAKSDGSARSFVPQQTQTAGQIGGPRPVLLLGAPGVGKGTQADILARLWDVPKISTGEILRENVANETALGFQANKIMRLGCLVPDEVITEMVANRLSHCDTAMGFIFDGFPRTIRQAQWLDTYLRVHWRAALLVVVSMCMDLQRLVDRVCHRRVCPICKTVYNTQLMRPKRSGRCDRDNSELIRRSDDNPEVFQSRLDVFKRETEPLIQYYRNHPLFIEVDAENPPSSVARDIVAGIGNKELLEAENR